MPLVVFLRRHLLGWRFWFAWIWGLVIAFGIHWGSYGLSPEVISQLPQLHYHPLPETLATLPVSTDQDYFSEVTTTPMGHLIWTNFPIKVYLPDLDTSVSPAAQTRQQQWQQAVTEAIAQWQPYLPLVITSELETADIVIRRQAPPVQKQVDPKTGASRYFLGRNAETRYEFYVDADQILRHRMTIFLNDHQGAIATENTARHELGHALGIWGHSPNSEDALFASQLGAASRITTTDINTLRKIYQQPTRLGWPMPGFKQ
ncbi:hypothetical protein NIES970_23690 [[Synechococcus] sp. NIES-970]|nr:hypothetical protein NIES970_23690 [[Synechococcus] sp. NIES-970]